MFSHQYLTSDTKNTRIAAAAGSRSGNSAAMHLIDNRTHAAIQRKQVQLMANKQVTETTVYNEVSKTAYAAHRVAYFVDNRKESITQKKQAGALAGRQAYNMSFQRNATATGLPDRLRSGIESISGYTMNDVKVHYNSGKPAQLQAHAFAQGTDIHIAPGQEKHLPHEAWHVVQQKQGRVRPTMQMKGQVNVNDDKGLEKEADIMGAKAAHSSVQGIFPSKQLTDHSNIIQNKNIVQRLPLVGNFATDVLSGTAFTLASNVSWLAGEQVRKTFSPVLTGAGFGTGMYAILRLGGLHGGAPADAAPRNEAWEYLRQKKTSTGGTFYVRAHLLRDRFGGPADWENLVPLTNAGNNVGGNPISHFHSVEQPIENALNNGRVVGYRVIPNYGGIPLLKTPTTIVNTLIGLIPGEWCRTLRNILYYENYVPTAIWTSWWYHDSWNPVPSVRVIRNWASMDASVRFTINRRTLTIGEWIVLGLSEALKMGISLAWPNGNAWSSLLDMARSFGIAAPAIQLLNLEQVMKWFDYVDGHYSGVARALGNFGSKDVAKEFRRNLPEQAAGLIPTIGEGAAIVSGIGKMMH